MTNAKNIFLSGQIWVRINQTLSENIILNRSLDLRTTNKQIMQKCQLFACE